MTNFVKMAELKAIHKWELNKVINIDEKHTHIM